MADYTSRAEVHGVVSLDDQMTRKLAGMQRTLDRLGTIGGKALSNLGRNIERLAIAGGIAGFFLVKDIVGAAAEFQDAMAAVEKTLDAASKTPANLKRINDGLIEMSKRIPVTAVELAEIAKIAGQLGIEGADDMLRFTETLAKLSKVTELDVAYAAENLGKLRTIFQMNADDVDHFAQVLVALENAAASSVQDILNVTRRFAGAGQAAGLSATQVAAFASTITSLGILPEAAGSSLSRLFQRTRVEFASASKKAKEFAKFLKTPFDELKKQLAKDPAGFFVKFFKRVNEILKSGTPLEKMDLAKRLKDLGIINVRDIDAVNKLAEGYEELVRQLEVAEGATTELDEAAKSRFASFQNQLQLFQNKLNAVAIVLGEALFPGLLKIMDTIGAWIETHGEEIKQFAKDVGEGFEKWMGSIKPEDISAFVGVLRSAVGWAQSLVSMFMSLPDWAKQLLIGIYVGNKLTGGAVTDLVSLLGKGLIKGVLGMTAGVVHLKAGTVIGAGMGGGPGGWSPTAGGTGGLAGLLKGLPLIGTALIGAEIANQVATGVADALRQHFPKQGQGDIMGDTLKTVVGIMTGPIGIPNLISGVSGIVAQIQAIIPLIDKPVDLSTRSVEKLKGAIWGPRNDPKGDRTMDQAEKIRSNIAKELSKAIPKNIARTKDIESLRGTALQGFGKITGKQETTNQKLGGIARRPPPKVNVKNQTRNQTNIKLNIDGRKLAHETYVHNSSSSWTMGSNWMDFGRGGAG